MRGGPEQQHFLYNAKLRQRIKTVELIVERKEWNPPKPVYGENTLVPLRIKLEEMPARSQAKAAEGKWNPEALVREIRQDFRNSAGKAYICRCLSLTAHLLVGCNK